MQHGSFDPHALERRLAALLPRWPDVAVCVALSGGLDSVVLLAALAQLREKQALRPKRVRAGRAVGRLRASPKRAAARLSVRAVHVHHGLHSNADAWATHSASVAKRLDIPLTVRRVKVARGKGVSVEAAARDARYAALADALDADEVLLTAHHEDDQLETVLLQLMRGAGVAGLAAMPEIAPFASGVLVRPLLAWSRSELERWAKAQDLTWADDDTNADEQFDRNYLRRQVLPLIRSRWPSAARAASRSARHAAEAKRLLDSLALVDVERASNGAELSVTSLRSLSPDRRRNAVRFWIARAGYPAPDTTRLEEIVSTLLEARAAANPHVDWNRVRVRRHADHLSIASVGGDSVAGVENEEVQWNWRASARIQFHDCSLEIEADAHGPIDLDALPSTLTIRHRQGGERIQPSRKGPTKTLKSLLQGSRVPLTDRAHLPLLFIDDKLVAVADRWSDASIQATSGTRTRARLRYQKNSA